MGKKELATMGDFQIVQRYEGMDTDLLDEIKDELDDLDQESGIVCRKIKIPSGGGLAYEVEGEESEDVEYKKEIQGVIVFTHRMSAWWRTSFGSANPDNPNRLPDCASMDGKTGISTQNGETITIECERCRYNQYGSGLDSQGNPTRGKACKNMRRLYLLMDNDPNLYLLTVPPTSMKEVNKKLQRILAGGIPYTGLVVRLTLEKVQNAAGTDYSRIVLNKCAPLSPEAAAKAIAVRRQIKEQYATMAITMEDYAPAMQQRQYSPDVYPDGSFDAADAPPPVERGGGFEEAPPYEEGNLPF